MGEVIQFIPKAERERIQLIREARAMYESVFPPADFVNEQRNKTPITQSVNGTHVRHGDKALS